MTDPSQAAFEFTVAPQARRIWQVHDLVGRVRTHVEREYADVYVEGEISNYRPADSGHLYFTLKDSTAQLRIVMFRNQARLMRFKPANGMQVIVRGRVTIYEDRGELQLMAEYMEPMGAGALQVAFEQLKARLAAEGLFDAARKKPLPALPRSIGIVTSARGAAIQDMLNILRRRHDSVHVLIYPAQVQGEAAPAEVSAGVRYFNVEMNVDVIIVARGGGSVEDLAAFNDEGLARAISASALPVISAVGHETDFTICDFVADLRAPTPSAAAELVVRSKAELGERLASLRTRLGRAARFQIMSARQALNALAQHGAFARMAELIARRQQRVDELTYALATAMRTVLQQRRRRMDTAAARVLHYDLRSQIQARKRELDATTRGFSAVMRKLLLARRARLDQAASRLQALSPLAILERGYALVFDANGAVLKDSTQVSAGQPIRARVAHGEIDATVTKVRKAHES